MTRATSASATGSGGSKAEQLNLTQLRYREENEEAAIN